MSIKLLHTDRLIFSFWRPLYSDFGFCASYWRSDSELGPHKRSSQSPERCRIIFLSLVDGCQATSLALGSTKPMRTSTSLPGANRFSIQEFQMSKFFSAFLIIAATCIIGFAQEPSQNTNPPSRGVAPKVTD